MPGQPEAARPGVTQPGRPQPGRPQPGRTGQGPDGPRDTRGRSPRRSPGPARWGALQGGLGVCIIVISAAAGTVATMVTRSAPGFLLGLLVAAGTVVAALAVRPRAGWMILPVPVLSYLAGALVSGYVYNRSAWHVQDGTGRRRGAVDRRRFLRDGIRYRAGHRDHHGPLVHLAAPQEGQAARPGLGGARHPARPAATAAGGMGPDGTRVRTQAPWSARSSVGAAGSG